MKQNYNMNAHTIHFYQLWPFIAHVYQRSLKKAMNITYGIQFTLNFIIYAAVPFEIL